MKKMIITLLALALIFSGSFIAIAEGPGQATVTNAAPTITGTAILNESWVQKTTIMPNELYYYNVTYYDDDGTDDLSRVNIDIRYLTTTYPDDPKQTYAFSYNNTTTTWSQSRPASGLYINSGISIITYINATTVNITFAITLNKTAKDTNGANDWNFVARGRDLSAATSVAVTISAIMAPYIEMSYTANAGGNSFSWSGSASSNQTASFTTVVTCNDIYTLDTSYTGWFQSPWGSPELWVKQSTQSTSTQVVNASASPGTNVTWYISSTGGLFDDSQGHYMYLVFPPGVEKGTVYSGVTIWVQARNN